MGGAARDLGISTDDESNVDPYDAYRMRNNPAYANDQLSQDLLGPREHGQFTEEVTARNPVQGAAVTLGAVGYSGIKAATGVSVGNSQGDSAKQSRASVDELFSAAEGFGRGLKKFFMDAVSKSEQKRKRAGAAYDAVMRGQ